MPGSSCIAAPHSPNPDIPAPEEITTDIPSIFEDPSEIFQAPIQHSIAAVNWTGWNYRVYYQNDIWATHGAICEAKQEKGKWTTSGSLFAAKRHTPLAAVCRGNGKEVSKVFHSPSQPR
jgi:hypothetical protein